VGDRVGQGTTGTMLMVWQQTEDLEARRAGMAIEHRRIVMELEQVVGVDDEASIDSGAGSGSHAGSSAVDARVRSLLHYLKKT
jgi:hypothetical protein